MNNQNKILCFFYSIIGLVILFLGYNYYVYRNTFSLDRKQYNISLETKYKMIVYGYKGKIQKNTNFKYKVDDESVATVDSNGTIIPKKVGKTNLVVTSKRGNNKRKAIINVLDEVAKTITVDKKSIILKQGNKDRIKVTINGDKDLIYNITYTSSNPDVVRVDEYGYIEALNPGNAVISISTSNGLTAECYVTVLSKKYNGSKNSVRTSNSNSSSNKPSTPTTPSEPEEILPTGIKLDSTIIDIKKGNKTTITAIVLPINSTDQSVKWNSSNNNIVSVDDNGNIEAKNYGSVTITASTINNKTATVIVNVKNDNVEVTGIKLSKSSATVAIGSVIGISSEVLPSNATNKTITWTSSDTSVATVSNGIVRGIKSGTVTITARTNNGKTATCTVIVKRVEPTSVSLNVTNKTMYIGDILYLVATITPSNVTDRSVVWSSSNTKVATVSGGTVIGYGVGTATITVKTSNGLKATCNVKILERENVIPVTSVSLNKTSFNLVEGNLYTLKATINPNNATNKGVKWTSSNTKVATVSNSGVVKGISPGTVTITATTNDGNKKASANVTVKKENLMAGFFLNSMNNPKFSKKLGANNAFIFRSIGGKYIVVDTGVKSSEIVNLVYNKLKSLQNSNTVVVDYLVLSHFDNDHYGNMADIISNDKIIVKEIIIKEESNRLENSSSRTEYNKIIKAAKKEKATITKANEKSGNNLEYRLDSNTSMYIFNIKDAFKGNKKCSSYSNYTEYSINFNTQYDDKSIIAKDQNGKYIYIEGSDYLSNGSKVKIKTSEKVNFNRNTSEPMKSRFYMTYRKLNNCRSNTQSMPVVFKVKTKNGNKYMFIPGDLENNGYYPFGEYDSRYGVTIHGVTNTYFPEFKIVNKEPRFYVNNNKLKNSTKISMVKVPAEYTTARDMINKFSDIKGNITVFQQSHHGLNNSPEMISLLGLNKSTTYSVAPVGGDPKNSTSIRSLMSQYNLRNTKIMFSGGKKQGIKCVINSSGQTACSNY